MGTASLNQGVRKLDDDQTRALAKKMEDFYQDLSPEERAHVNLALSRMGDDLADVSGHASLAEYGLLLSLIAAFL